MSAYSERMTEDHRDQLYEAAETFHKAVAATATAYDEAVKARANSFKALRDAGESAAAIGKRLGLSRSRVGQIVQLAEVSNA